MALDPDAVCAGLKARLLTISGLRAKEYAADSVTPPEADSWLEGIEYDQAMQRGLDRHTYTMRLYVSKASDRAGQKAAYQYMSKDGPKSVKVAVEGDRTLGGACATSRVVRLSRFGVVTVGQADYIAADWEVEVFG